MILIPVSMMIIMLSVSWAVVLAFNPSTQKAGTGRSLKSGASLFYRASSRTGSKATEKPCLEKSNSNNDDDDDDEC